MSDEDIDIALDDPVMPTIVQVVCVHTGCGRVLANTGPKWVHLDQLPPELDHAPEPAPLPAG